MDEKQIVQMYTEKQKSTYEIAKHFSTYPNKVRRILVKNKVPLKTRSEAQKNALDNGSSKIPTLGKKRTKDEKLKISRGRKKAWSEMSEEKYAEYVKAAKRRWEEMSEEHKKTMRILSVKAIQAAGKEGSKLEKFLYKEITRANIKSEQHKKNLIVNERLEIDLYFPALKTILEIDGPSHFLPIWGEEKLQKQIKADEQKTGLILSKGFAIIRVKIMSDSLSLDDKEKLKNNIIDILHGIETKFPKKSERYIEIKI